MWNKIHILWKEEKFKHKKFSLLLSLFPCPIILYYTLWYGLCYMIHDILCLWLHLDNILQRKTFLPVLKKQIIMLQMTEKNVTNNSMSPRIWGELLTYIPKESRALIHTAIGKWNQTATWTCCEIDSSPAEIPGTWPGWHLDSRLVKLWAEDSVRLCLDFWPTEN